MLNFSLLLSSFIESQKFNLYIFYKNLSNPFLFQIYINSSDIRVININLKPAPKNSTYCS